MVGRRRAGTIEERDGRFYVRLTITLDNGKTARRRAPKGGLSTRESAEALRDRLSNKATGRVFVSSESPTISVADYTERLWLPSREKRGLKTVRKDRERLRAHVLPIIGRISMQDVDADALRDLVESLDAKVRNPLVKFSWKTAWHCWMTTHKLFDDAVSSKRGELRLLKANPTLGVTGPDKGSEKALQWLYPTEFSRLMACPEVPIRWRRIYAVGTLLFLRWGEVRGLAWRDIDLDAGTAHIHEQVDDETGEVCPTKTRDVRDVPIEPTLLALLRVLRAEEPDAERLFDSVDQPAKTLREHLLRAGVTRSALHVETETSLPIRFHDLRATGITWLAMRNDPAHQIMARAGHLTLEMSQHYQRRAELVGKGVGAPFPELPAELSIRPGIRGHGSEIEPSRQCEGGDLNPRPRQVCSSSCERDLAQSDIERHEGTESGTNRLPVRELPDDGQSYVAEQLAEAYPAAFDADSGAVLMPLARASAAIQSGREPTPEEALEAESAVADGRAP